MCEGPILHRREILVALVGATGTLVVGCVPGGEGGDFILVSPQQEAELGQQTWSKIRAERAASSNAEMNRMLGQVAGRLVSATGGNPAEWEFVVFQGQEKNAFAVPGNKVGVYEGMFSVAGSDAQLAAVVGHEISHVHARHGARRISRSMAAEIGMQALMAAMQAGDVAATDQIAGLLGAGVQYGVILPYSRDQELEADRLGVEAMARAGYDPQEAVRFWEAMAQAEGRGAPPEFMSTHPADATRIQALQAELPAAMAIYQRQGQA
ncbi:M48 family metallopeptidase [Inquilinus limosus]|uniref:M48 family metallopeptidase n=1 Tax=Inquilinus limosus TaxID=171674 RepID=UPI003F186AFD